jgi:hypothetical protein
VIPVPPGPELPPDQPPWTWTQGIEGPALPASRVAALEQAVLLVGLAARGSVTVRSDDGHNQDLAKLGGNVLALAGEFDAWLTAPPKEA